MGTLGPGSWVRLRPLRLFDLDEKMSADTGEARTGDHDDLGGTPSAWSSKARWGEGDLLS